MHRKPKTLLQLLLLTVLGFGLKAYASEVTDTKTITFSYWDQASPPIAFETENMISGGILKEIGDAIGAHLKLPVEYVKLPVARIEPYLRSGQIDADCITSNIWKETPEQYNWSPKLFDGADLILIRKDSPAEIKSFHDLKGLRLGIYIGYVYHPEIMKMMEQGTITPVKVSDVHKGIQLLQLGRIDALIDFGVSLRYQLLTQKLHDQLTLAEKHADDFELSCAYSQKSDIDKEIMDKAIRHLIESGQINKILSKYRK